MALNITRAFCTIFLSTLAAVSLFGCATPKKPLTGLVPGRNVETLQSAISVTAKAGEQTSGGRGCLIYKAPQLFHLALISPFGQTVLEAYSDSDRFTCLIPSRQTAYSGLLSELPETSALKSFELLKWVMAPSPLPVPVANVGETLVISGESYHFDEIGMLERKVSRDGDEVRFEGYRSIEGIAFPDSIVIQNRYGAMVRITFDEPQINAPVDPAALTPDLTGMVVLPLAEFKAM